MNTAGSVTRWLRALETGNDDAATRLWDRYASALKGVAQRRMRRQKQRDIADEEDIVVTAFADLCLAARRGRLAGIANRDELWGMLIVLAHRKVGQRLQYVNAAKRNSGLLADQEVRDRELGSRLEQLVARSPTPELQSLLAEQADVLLAKLNDPDLQALAVLRLAGYTNDEIATSLGLSRRTIYRMVAHIRTCWKEFDVSEGEADAS